MVRTSPSGLQSQRSDYADDETRWPRALKSLSSAALEVQRRPLTSDEATCIVREIRDSPYITGYSSAEWMGGKDTFALMDLSTQTLLGAALTHQLILGWREFAVLFIRSPFRRFGLGGWFFGSVIRTLAHCDQNIILFYTTDDIEQLAVRNGLEIFSDEHSMSRGNLWHLTYLQHLYPLQWLANPYRRSERQRKRKELGAQFHFKIAARLLR